MDNRVVGERERWKEVREGCRMNQTHKKKCVF